MTDPRSGLAVSPFRALRFTINDPTDSRLVNALCPPYDVVDDEQRTRLELASPHNAVRLVLPRGPESGADSRYAAAASTLADWQRDGVLGLDDVPALYGYEMSYQAESGPAHTRGLLATVTLRAPEDGVILPHENTMAGPVADRLALTRATEANLEPIYLVYSGGGAPSDLLDRLADTSPQGGGGTGAAGDVPAAAMTAAGAAAAAGVLVVDVVTDDGVRHRLWQVSDRATIDAVQVALSTRRAVIADGHHRYATYRQYQADRRDGGAGPGPWDRGLAFLVDASTSGPTVHATHRVIPSLPLGDAIHRLRDIGRITELPDGDPERAISALAAAGRTGQAFALTDGSRAVLVSDLDPDAVAAAVPADHAAAWRELDVTVAHHLLIRDRWALQDHESVVGFEHDPAAAVRDAAGGTVLLLNPTPVAAVAAVAEAAERMPRKSTLFTPKPRTGLVLRPLHAAGADN